MKILKRIVLTLVVIVALALIVAAFMKKDYSVKREVVINKPKQEVFNYIKFLKNQDHYSVWAKMDPNMKKSYKGTDGEVGFISAWDSKKDDVGKGEQEIRKIVEGKRIDVELRFKKPFEATEKGYMTTDAAGENSTKVTWGFDGHMDWPMNIMFLFMDMEAMIGKDLQNGLNNLKKKLE